MSEICTICHNNIEKNKNIVITECSHAFHFSCLLKNIKTNETTGNNCPLCRFNFIKSIKPPDNLIIASNFTIPPGNFGSYTFINRRVEIPVIRPTIRPTIRPAIRPTIRPSVNSIIPRRLRDAGKIKQIKDKIKKLTYTQLKKKLKDLNLSTRGYMRTSLEKRLTDHILVMR